MTLQVDPHDLVPLRFGHVDDDAVAQDPGVVDKDVEVAERLDGAVDQLLGTVPVGDVVAVGDRLTTSRADLLHDLVGRSSVDATPVVGPAQVVDHHLRALGGEQQRVLAPQASPGPGDDRDTPFQCTHGPAR